LRGRGIQGDRVHCKKQGHEVTRKNWGMRLK